MGQAMTEYRRLAHAHGWNTGTVGASLGVAPATIYKRWRLGVAYGCEAWQVMAWLSGRGALTTIDEDREAETLRDAPIYRAKREALGLSQVDLADELGVTGQTISNRETARGRFLITREQALALMVVADRVQARQVATIEALRPAQWDRAQRLPSPAGKRAGDWERILATMRPDHRARFDAEGRKLARDGRRIIAGETLEQIESSGADYKNSPAKKGDFSGEE
jgi:transcriptional regulator with XRE-family HTH domain